MSITTLPISRRYRRAAAGAVAALTLGGLLAGCGSSSSTSSTANAAPAAATSSAPSGAQQTPPGFGTVVTGAAADKAKAAALAKYPGTVERVMKLSDGSYVVHVIRSSGEVHVKVSKTFTVTGTEQGPPGGAPPSAGGTTTQS
jgi:glucose/arabinose dehydrogenase